MHRYMLICYDVFIFSFKKNRLRTNNYWLEGKAVKSVVPSGLRGFLWLCTLPELWFLRTWVCPSSSKSLCSWVRKSVVLSILELLDALYYPVLWRLSVCAVQNTILNLPGYSVTLAGWFEWQFLYGLITDLYPELSVSKTQLCYWYRWWVCYVTWDKIKWDKTWDGILGGMVIF